VRLAETAIIIHRTTDARCTGGRDEWIGSIGLGKWDRAVEVALKGVADERGLRATTILLARWRCASWKLRKKCFGCLSEEDEFLAIL
jgi:hypothetical protein